MHRQFSGHLWRQGGRLRGLRERQQLYDRDFRAVVRTARRLPPVTDRALHMKTMALTTCAMVMLWVGCDERNSGTDGGVSVGIPLVPDENGHYDGSNAAEVVGYWWSTDDDHGADDATLGSGSCRADGFPAGACSVLTSPTPGAFFAPNRFGRMCASGVAAQVVPDASGNLARSAIWGAMIGFDVNNPGTLADRSGTRDVYDAPAHGVTGFAFDIDGVPPGGHLRVRFATRGTENDAAYWGGASADLSPVASPGHYEIRWPEVGGPLDLPSPPPFDPTKLEAIQFQVVANDLERTLFSFCVWNVMLLTS
jgi:hypothetical protein